MSGIPPRAINLPMYGNGKRKQNCLPKCLTSVVHVTHYEEGTWKWEDVLNMKLLNNIVEFSLCFMQCSISMNVLTMTGSNACMRSMYACSGLCGNTSFWVECLQVNRVKHACICWQDVDSKVICWTVRQHFGRSM